jgi:subtilisin family serine protease
LVRAVLFPVGVWWRAATSAGIFLALIPALPASAAHAPGDLGGVVCTVDEAIGSPLGICPRAPVGPPASEPQAAEPQPTPGGGDIVADRILAKFVRGARAADVQKLLADLAVTTVRQIPQLRVRVLRVAPERREKTIADLERSPLVARAEHELLVQAVDVTPNDKGWTDQWGPRLVSAPRAWEVTRGSQSVTVAILDTGVDGTHPDLRGSVVGGYDVINQDAVAEDAHGHGTAVAGVIGARTNNGEGQAGLCWTCSLLAIRVLGADGFGTTSTIAEGIVRAADAGARVLNLSLGGNATTETQSEAVAYALARGAVVVAAAGNDGQDKTLYPAANAGVIGVAATDERDRLYGWSNRGSAVRVAAPGCNTAPLLHGAYTYFCGTSAATPVVAGIVALLLSVDPTFTSAEIEHALQRSAVPVPGLTFGRVDAARTLEALAGPRTRFATTGRVARSGGRSYPITAGLGTVDATLRVRGPSRVTLALVGADGRTLEVTSGTGELRVRQLVGPHTYVLRVSAPRGTSYALTVAYSRVRGREG